VPTELAKFLHNRRVLLCYGLMGEGLVRLGLGYMQAPAEWFAA
jgi:hypothetical protein